MRSVGYLLIRTRIMVWSAIWLLLEIPRSAHAGPALGEPLAPSPATATIEFREGMAIAGLNRNRRAPVAIDPVAIQFVAGSWAMPKAGDSVIAAQGQNRRWEPIKASADGTFRSSAFEGGYVASTVTSANETVMMLEASGHLMVYVNGTPRAGIFIRLASCGFRCGSTKDRTHFYFRPAWADSRPS